MPRTRRTADEIRAEALDHARRLVVGLGPDKLRLTDVAKAMGLSHAALYAHFASKADLLETVLRDWLASGEAALAAETTTLGWALALYQAKRARALAEPALYAAFNTAMVHDTEAARAHVAALKAQLAARLAAEAYPPEAADLVFEATLAWHHPALIGARAQEDRSPALVLLLETLLRGLQPRR